MKVGLLPVKLAGLFKMYVSRTDKSRGPFLHADISTSKAPYIEASGFVELLGMSAEVKLLITSSKYEFSMNGKFLIKSFPCRASYRSIVWKTCRCQLCSIRKVVSLIKSLEVYENVEPITFAAFAIVEHVSEYN